MFCMGRRVLGLLVQECVGCRDVVIHPVVLTIFIFYFLMNNSL